MKVALVEFAATDTVAGSVILPVEVNVTVAAVADGLLKLTVQIASAPGTRDIGAQEIPLSSEVVIAVAVPPVPLIVSPLPSSAAPSAETPTEAEVVVDASVIDTVATLPLAMRLELMPVATQI